MIDDQPDPRSALMGGVRPRRATFEARRPHAPGRPVWAIALVLLIAAPAAAQPRRGGATPTPTPTPRRPAPADKVEPTDAAAPSPGNGAKGKPPKVFDFTGLDLAGRLRTPQLLYFLDRASEELERASLERRSFIPAMVRSIDEHDL